MIEGFTIYFFLKEEPKRNDAILVDGEFVQFIGSKKPTRNEINEAFRKKFPRYINLDLSSYPDHCFVWRYDADPRVKVEFSFEYIEDDGEMHEDWEWEWDDRETCIYERTYYALLQGGKPAITAYIESFPSLQNKLLRKCRMRKIN